MDRFKDYSSVVYDAQMCLFIVSYDKYWIINHILNGHQ